ncbi:MAG: hypothetical protein DMG81_08060 [Acidobacteria bacterium]|nr:MAG: hypothetical protein DMG81_08060 [Acidobacteriota bacterium]
MVAAAPISVFVSTDGGATFTSHSLRQYVSNIRGVTVTPDSHIFVASREGAFESTDEGATWTHVLTGLPDKDITSIVYDGSGKRLLATSMQTGVIFESSDNGRTWQRGPDSGYPLRRVNVVRGRFIGATPFDGVILQPENESQSAAAGTGGTN